MRTSKIYFALISLSAFLSLLFLNLSPAYAQIPAAPNSVAGSGTSYNWAGFTASGGSFSSVSGNWIIPGSSASGSMSADAEWVGIGGVNNSDLIQVGTQTIFNNNQPSYQAWYELLPGSSQTINLTVKPGDSMSGSLTLQPNGQWLISLLNNTTGQNFQTTVSYSSSQSSAEWIEEMPTAVGSGFIPLDNFGTAQFTGSVTTKNGQQMNLSQLSAQPMNMVTTSQQTLASPSGIASDGASFTVSRSSVVVTPSSTTRGFGRGGFHRQGRGAQGFRIQAMSGFGFGRFGHSRQSLMSMFGSTGLRFYVLSIR